MANAELSFSIARQVAENSDFTKTHVGCVIVYKNSVIASGHNTNKTHPMQKKYNRIRSGRLEDDGFAPKMHAEIMALSKLSEEDIDTRKLCLYTYRIRKDKDFGMARPCPSCMQAIKDMGIRKICYTTDDGYATETISGY